MKPVIVCVDDEKVILDSLKAQLKSAFGSLYAYEIAENSKDALDLIEELHDEGRCIVVIVSDWLMPGMKGDDLLVNIHVKFPDVVSIMLSGQADESAINHAFTDANLFKFIKKPWSEDELINSIRAAIALFQTRTNQLS
jgi:DNA-binding NtrC family response regulator